MVAIFPLTFTGGFRSWIPQFLIFAYEFFIVLGYFRSVVFNPSLLAISFSSSSPV